MRNRSRGASGIANAAYHAGTNSTGRNVSVELQRQRKHNSTSRSVSGNDSFHRGADRPIGRKKFRDDTDI